MPRYVIETPLDISEEVFHKMLVELIGWQVTVVRQDNVQVHEVEDNLPPRPEVPLSGG